MDKGVPALIFPNEPSRFSTKDIEPFLVWCIENEGSDITIQTNDRVVLAAHGKIHRVTRHKISQAEIMEWVVSMYGSESAKSKLSGENAFLDFSYEVKPDRNSRHRFRVNATAIQSNGGDGLQMTIRTIRSIPPKLQDMGVDPEIIANLAPSSGLILVTGATGSGKSTLLASFIRYLAEDPDAHRKILTYEAPIEFVYDEVDKPTTSIAQTEIPRHIKNFSEGVRNALRRKPDIILIGEARDAETIGETITASTTGHLAYSTVHSSGFAETIRRMVNSFEEDKASRALDIISSLRMVISQKLVPSTDGKRVALREWVIFNEEITSFLLDAGVEDLPSSCRHVLKKYGHSFQDDARSKHAAGIISDKTLKEMDRAGVADEKEIRAHHTDPSPGGESGSAGLESALRGGAKQGKMIGKVPRDAAAEILQGMDDEAEPQLRF